MLRLGAYAAVVSVHAGAMGWRFSPQAGKLLPRLSVLGAYQSIQVPPPRPPFQCMRLGGGPSHCHAARCVVLARG